MVLVDSSVWIEGFRRQGSLEVKVALEGLLEAYEAQWCSPVRLEVLGGARASERARLGRHFAVIPYRVCTEKDWDRAVALAWRIRDRGLTIPWLDVVIAALALHDEVRLFTIGAHFRDVAAITGLRLYEAGHGGSYQAEAIG